MFMKTLKLDATYRPIEVIDSLDALVLCILGKARAIENYEEQISSPSVTFNFPCVIVLDKAVKFSQNNAKPNRTNVLWRDNNICQYCNNKFLPNELTLDHVIPKSRGGKNTWFNLVTCCKECNQKKRNKTPEEARMSLVRPPFKPKNVLMRHIEPHLSVWKEYIW